MGRSSDLGDIAVRSLCRRTRQGDPDLVLQSSGRISPQTATNCPDASVCPLTSDFPMSRILASKWVTAAANAREPSAQRP